MMDMNDSDDDSHHSSGSEHYVPWSHIQVHIDGHSSNNGGGGASSSSSGAAPPLPGPISHGQKRQAEEAADDAARLRVPSSGDEEMRE